MSGRWPPLFTTNDQDCFRERITTERMHAHYSSRPIHSNNVADKYKLEAIADRPFVDGVGVQATSVAAALQELRGAPPPAARTSSQLFSQFRRPVAPFIFEGLRQPARTQPHQEACTRMALSTSWHGRPLVLSRGGVNENFLTHSHSEPRGMFNSILQQSTTSAAIPAVPLVPWKLDFMATLPSPEFTRVA